MLFTWFESNLKKDWICEDNIHAYNISINIVFMAHVKPLTLLGLGLIKINDVSANLTTLGPR